MDIPLQMFVLQCGIWIINPTQLQWISCCSSHYLYIIVWDLYHFKIIYPSFWCWVSRPTGWKHQPSGFFRRQRQVWLDTKNHDIRFEGWLQTTVNMSVSWWFLSFSRKIDGFKCQGMEIVAAYFSAFRTLGIQNWQRSIWSKCPFHQRNPIHYYFFEPT